MQKKQKNKKKIHNIFFVLCCSVLFTLFCGCTIKDKNITEITLIHSWGSTESDHIAMRQIYQDFEKANPDIHLNLVSLPTNDALLRKVEDMVMVGEIPDIVFLAGKGRDSVYQYMVDFNYALDIMPSIMEDETFYKNIAPANLDYWTTGEHKLFTVSDVLISGGGYWYNKDIFEAAGIESLPNTWEEFETVCKKIEHWAREKNNDVSALQPSTEGFLYFASHILAQKGIINTKEQLVVEDDKMKETLSILKDIYSYSLNNSSAYNYRDETSLFNSGKLGIYINGVWGAAMINEDLNAEYALLPKENSGSICCESSGVGYVLGNTGDSVRQNASIRFLKYMLSQNVQERILLQTQQVPANPQIDINKFGEKMPRFCQAVSTVKNAQTKIEIPRQLWSNHQISVFRENIISVLSREISDEKFIEMLKK